MALQWRGYDPEMRLYGGEEMEIGAVETRHIKTIPTKI